jgi:hypothetical protein
MAIRGSSPTRVTFDLVRIAERAFNSSQRKTIIPLLRRDSIKLEYGRRAIEEIRQNTARSKDKNDSRFESYSDAYKSSLAYRAFGKSSTVNLELSGQMLSDLEVLGATRTGVQVGFSGGLSERKAHGHITGARGRLPVRDFLGLPPDDEEKLLKETIRSFQDGTPVVDFQDLARIRATQDTQLIVTAGSGVVGAGAIGGSIAGDDLFDLAAVFSGQG